MTSSSQDAATLDQVIDNLLSDRGSPGVVEAEPELASTARLLRDALPRFHPRFGFEESVARRIAIISSASAAARGAISSTSSEPIPFPGAVANEPQLGTGRDRRLGLLAGGAIASGVSIAIPLTGAALVMWRRSRSRGGLL